METDDGSFTVQFTNNIETTSCKRCGETVGVLRTQDGKRGLVNMHPRAVWAPALGKEVVLGVRGRHPIRVVLPVDAAPVCEAWIPHRLTCRGSRKDQAGGGQ